MLQDPLDLQSEPWSKISTQAKDVVKKLLVRDPAERATADEILQHEWMKENGVASDKYATFWRMPVYFRIECTDSRCSTNELSAVRFK